MSDSDKKTSISSKRWLVGGTLVTLIYCVTMAIILGPRVSCFLATAELNNIGDFLAGLFAPLAFLWLFIGIRVQGLELQVQGEELRKNVEHQKEIAVAANQALSEHEPRLIPGTLTLVGVRHTVVKTAPDGSKHYSTITNEQVAGFPAQLSDGSVQKIAGLIYFDFNFEVQNFGGKARSFIATINNEQKIPKNSAIFHHYDRRILESGEKELFVKQAFTVESLEKDGHDFILTIFGFDGLNRFFRQDFKSNGKVKITMKSGYGIPVHEVPTADELLDKVE